MRKRTWALSTNLFTLFAVLWALAAAAATAMRFHWAVLWLAVLLFIAYLAYRKVYLPYVRIEKVFGRYISGRTIDELFELPAALTPDLPQVFTKVADAMDKQNQLKNAMKQAEFLALQNQINPHFLYNTLEAIRGDALQAGLSTIVDVTEALAMYFRYTISRVDRLVTLSDELRNAASYFAIQKYRYGERVNMDIRYAPEDAYLLGARIPKLTLQPLIENAITHGLEPKISAGHIVIQFECTQSRLLIEVSDDGVGVSPETLTELRARLLRQVSDYEGEAGPEGGIALVNVNSRLRLLFGEQFGVSLDSTQGFGTDVSITLPLTFDEREDGRP